MCCSTTNVIKGALNCVPTRGHFVWSFIRNDTGQGPNSSSSFLPLYREQPRSTRTVIAYPRPALLATKRSTTLQYVLINKPNLFKAPSCKNKKNESTEAHIVGGLAPVTLAHEPTSSRPKHCESLKYAHSNLTCWFSSEENKPWSKMSYYHRTPLVQYSPSSSTIELLAPHARRFWSVLAR